MTSAAVLEVRLRLILVGGDPAEYFDRQRFLRLMTVVAIQAGDGVCVCG
jgi:hypothetical protein